MKLKLLALFALIYSTSVSAQNTFPSSGHVGIGTASPTHPLHVLSSTPVFKLQNASYEDTDNAYYAYITSLDKSGDEVWWIGEGSTGNKTLGFYTSRPGYALNLFNQGKGIKIVNGGNVGIGAESAPEQLTVGAPTGSPNIQLGRWAFLGQESSHLTTVLGGNAKVLGNQTVVAESTVDGYRAIRMRYDQGITFHAYTGWVSAGDVVGSERMRIAPDGNVGIGTPTPQNELDVNGTIRAKEVIVETNWPDYVFEPGYELRSLDEVERHIAERGHLPGVPSAAEVAEGGVSLGETQRILLEKVEELTLYMIAMQKEKDREIAELREEVSGLKEAGRL